MDDKLVPLMVLLLAVFLAWVLYSGFAFWRRRRVIAWNVVQAALTRRHLAPEQMAEVDGAVREVLADLRMTPAALARAPVAVRFAVDSMAMHRLGMVPFGNVRPFGPLRSPHLARSVAQHIRVVRFRVENRHNLRLTELDTPSSANERNAP